MIHSGRIIHNPLKRETRPNHGPDMTELIEGRYFERLPGERKTFRELMERYLKEHSLVTKTLKSRL